MSASKGVRVDVSGLKNVKPWEYGLRFVFGGVITACAGLVAHHWGPVVGGMFLAFPAILPASLTLVKQHDGRAKATDDARGGRLGTIGLMGFGFVVWTTARIWPPPRVLALALLTWLAVDVTLYFVRYRKEIGR